MQKTSEIYKTLLRNPNRDVETRLTIGGVAYKGPILDLSTTGGLFSSQTPSIGCCVSREIDFTIFPTFAIPRMAEIKVESRLILPDLLTGEVLEASEWLPKGTFYIDTRYTNVGDGSVVIHGYDAMLKAEQPFLTDTTEDDWPKPMDEVAAEIAERMGVKVDSRTVVSHTLQAGYPLEYTMREVLGFIASAHAGNWIITDAGELRLVGLADIPPETFYLVTEDGDAILFGDTRILI